MNNFSKSQLAKKQTFKFEARKYSSAELVEIANAALSDGDQSAANKAWRWLADIAPAALSRIAPNRAHQPLEALESLIRDVRMRVSLKPNMITDRPFESPTMRGFLHGGAREEIMFMEVAYVYANPEGYKLKICVQQRCPLDPIFYHVDYFEPVSRVFFPDELANSVNGKICLPSDGFVKFVEHVLSRISAGQHLGPNGLTYRNSA